MNSNNNTKTIMALFVYLVLVYWIQMASATNEVKPSRAIKLCGQDFIKTWQKLCYLKQLKGRKRRSLEDASSLTKLKTNDIKQDFIPPQDAKRFLKSLHHRNRRQALVGGLDNATEECCNETCTFKEIAEYDC